MDFALNDEQTRWRDVAREFALNVIKPDVLRRDRLPTVAERIPWDWIRQADKLGLRESRKRVEGMGRENVRRRWKSS